MVPLKVVVSSEDHELQVPSSLPLVLVLLLHGSVQLFYPSAALLWVVYPICRSQADHLLHDRRFEVPRSSQPDVVASGCDRTVATSNRRTVEAPNRQTAEASNRPTVEPSERRTVETSNRRTVETSNRRTVQ